ncbi:MAG: hypothetical protein M3N52_03215 [Actinomycetota bacterium]|nr:hypothetical protein [Actinomycetota bacterium]
MSVDLRSSDRVGVLRGMLSDPKDALRPLARPTFVYLLSRALALSAVALGAVARGEHDVLRALAIWDGAWYLGTAVRGYPDYTLLVNGEAAQSNVAFFPLYPMAIQGLSRLTGMAPLAAAALVSLAAGLAATLLLWVLVRRICDEEVADRSVLLFCFFPASVVLSMVYSESLMLALAIACLLGLLSRRWLSAGVAGALASAARPSGVVMAACCLWEAGQAIRRDRDWRAVAAPLLAPVGFVGFMLFLWRRTGNPGAWFRIQREGWGERFDFGWRTVHEVWLVVQDPLGPGNTMRLQVLGLAFTACALYLLWRWRPPAVVTIYTLGILVLSLGSWTLGARPRFVLTAFPLLVAVARAVRGRWFAAVLALSALAMVLLAVVYTTPRLAVP